MKASKGNFNITAEKIGPWVMGLGNLNPAIDSNLRNDHFGLKWSKVKKGTKKEVATANSGSKTIGILIYGKFEIRFSETNESIILDKEGDYVFLPEDCKHTYNFFEDSFVISLRWPPLDDQY
jgi:hypothetical protein